MFALVLKAVKCAFVRSSDAIVRIVIARCQNEASEEWIRKITLDCLLREAPKTAGVNFNPQLLCGPFLLVIANVSCIMFVVLLILWQESSELFAFRKIY